MKFESIDLNTVDQETYADDNGDEEFASQVVDAYLAEVNLVDSSTSSKAWYLDSGASNHVTRDSSVFSSLSPSSRTKIISTCRHSRDVTGVGNVAICLPSRGIQNISHVLYSLGITKNLISVGFLADKRFCLEFMKNKCAIKNSGEYFVGLAHGNHTNGLYKLQGVTLIDCYEVPVHAPNVHSLSCADSSKVALAQKVRPLSFQGIRHMMQFGAVKGLPKMAISNFPCSSCISGKQSRKSIPKVKSTLSTIPLQLIHLDVARPFRISSLGGARYFLTFIDDFPRKHGYISYHLKTKSMKNFKFFIKKLNASLGSRLVPSDLIMEESTLPKPFTPIVRLLAFSRNSLNPTLHSTMV